MTSEEYDKLTDKEKRIKVAEHSGKWMNCHITDDGIAAGRPTVGNPNNLAMLPNYLYDLNAMHEAEMIFGRSLRARCNERYGYEYWLEKVAGPGMGMVMATASQRAKAFVLARTQP
jgi:hypothetical protein